MKAILKTIVFIIVMYFLWATYKRVNSPESYSFDKEGSPNKEQNQR